MTLSVEDRTCYHDPACRGFSQCTCLHGVVEYLSPAQLQPAPVQDVKAGITHVIVEPDAVDKLPPQLLPDAKRTKEPPPALVTPDWLVACLAERGHASELPFTVVAGTHGDDLTLQMIPMSVS